MELPNILSLSNKGKVSEEDLETSLEELEINLCKFKGKNGYKLIVYYVNSGMVMVGWEIDGNWNSKTFLPHETKLICKTFDSIEIK